MKPSLKSQHNLDIKHPFYFLLCNSLNLLIFTGVALAGQTGHLHPERWYQEQWCSAQDGIMEYRLSDGTRVDCLTDKYAIEVDFASKWAEAVGQALYYGASTGKKPKILLIMEHPNKDIRYLNRLFKVVSGIPALSVELTVPMN